MTRCVALWRGINVGRAKRLAMADLKGLLAELGATEVATVLNSGNAVFNASRLTPARIRAAVAERLGVDAAVIVKTAPDFAAIAAEQPIPGAVDPSRLLVVLTADAQTLADLRHMVATDEDRFVVTDRAAYLWCANGILVSRTAALLLKRLGDRGTTRNWLTVTKLAALL